MKIAVYCRVSTDKNDQINSLEAQKVFFNDYVKKNGYTLVDIYPDEGISGVNIKNRAQFNRMINDAKAGKIDMIITKEVSRFARNTVDTLSITRMLKSLGVGVYFLSDNINTFDNDGELRLSIMATLAQEESRKISSRVKWGKKQTAEKGRVPNIIYGYDRIEGNNYDLHINEHEAYVIRRIYDLYLNHGCGATKIANMLNSEGLRTKRNCKWSQNAICRILSNPVYIGKIINNKEETEDFLTGKRIKTRQEEWCVKFKPEFKIIEDELFEKAQKVLNQRRDDFILFKKRQSNSHLFSTLIKCGDCGYSFSRRFSKESRPKWHCTSRTAKGQDFCSNHIILGECELIEKVNIYFKDLVINKKATVQKLVENFKKQYNGEYNSQTEKSLLDKLKRIESKHERYAEMYADGLLSKEQINKKIKELNKERAPIEETLAEIEMKNTKAEKLDDVLNTTFAGIEKINDVQELTNAQLKCLIDHIEVKSDGKVNIYLKMLKEIGLIEPLYLHTSVHQDITMRLEKTNMALHKEVKAVLEKNKQERHIRGGMATKLKYSMEK